MLLIGLTGWSLVWIAAGLSWALPPPRAAALLAVCGGTSWRWRCRRRIRAGPVPMSAWWRWPRRRLRRRRDWMPLGWGTADRVLDGWCWQRCGPCWACTTTGNRPSAGPCGSPARCRTWRWRWRSAGLALWPTLLGRLGADPAAGAGGRAAAVAQSGFAPAGVVLWRAGLRRRIGRAGQARLFSRSEYRTGANSSLVLALWAFLWWLDRRVRTIRHALLAEMQMGRNAGAFQLVRALVRRAAGTGHGPAVGDRADASRSAVAGWRDVARMAGDGGTGGA
ncbi:MAG: hypothetical protein MZU84_05360 [Sphingobacterium sp.]|nr:hypothetical protein [Sphingobacterium sp.]